MSNVWESIKPFVAKFAPMLGGALGGPLGAAAGAVISSALGVKDADPKSLEAAIKSGSLTGEQIVALKVAEDQFALQMAQLDIKSVEDMEKLAVADRDSARKREIEVKDWTPRLLAYGVTVGFFSLLVFMMLRQIPPENKDVLNIMLGALGGSWISIITYYFGSSAGSDKKTAMLGKK